MPSLGFETDSRRSCLCLRANSDHRSWRDKPARLIQWCQAKHRAKLQLRQNSGTFSTTCAPGTNCQRAGCTVQSFSYRLSWLTLHPTPGFLIVIRLWCMLGIYTRHVCSAIRHSGTHFLYFIFQSRSCDVSSSVKMLRKLELEARSQSLISRFLKSETESIQSTELRIS